MAYPTNPVPEMKQILDTIIREFDIGDFVDYDPAHDPSCETGRLTTSRGVYFIKPGMEERELVLYSDVEKSLNESGVRQAEIFRTQSGSYLSSTGYAVFEFLDGSSLENPSTDQFDSFIEYFARYNLALAEIQVPDWVQTLKNPWDKADSIDWLLDSFPSLRPFLELTPLTENAIDAALEFLDLNRDSLAESPKQLTHGDAGPGNILYRDSNVVAVIDFTPYLESHLYSLCVSLYWHCLYFNDGIPDFNSINRALAIYVGKYPFTDDEISLFHAMFVKAASRMLFVQLVFNLEYGRGKPGERNFPTSAIDEMAANLLTVIDSEPNLKI